MFPVVAHKDLTDFIDLCKECGSERLYVSINHDLRRQQQPDRIALTKWLSLYLSAFFIDPTTKSPFVSRFWTVECVDSDGVKAVIARPEEDIRKFYLMYIRIAEQQIGCPSLRGYATWLGDPALVPGTPGMLPKEWVDSANDALVEEGVFTRPESVPEAEGGADAPAEPESPADGQDVAAAGSSEPVGEVPDEEYEAAKEKAAESAEGGELEVTKSLKAAKGVAERNATIHGTPMHIFVNPEGEASYYVTRDKADPVVEEHALDFVATIAPLDAGVSVDLKTKADKEE